jgi:dUTP pyrophosphatase
MKFLKLRDVKSPSRGTSQSAGIDFFIPNDFEYRTLSPGSSVLIPSGIKANIPSDHVFIAFNKSGVATKKGLTVGACVVDEDYQGEIHIHLTNVSDQTITINPGEKIIQFLLLPIIYESIEIVESEESLWEGKSTERGEGGFGSTGIK